MFVLFLAFHSISNINRQERTHCCRLLELIKVMAIAEIQMVDPLIHPSHCTCHTLHCGAESRVLSIILSI